MKGYIITSSSGKCFDLKKFKAQEKFVENSNITIITKKDCYDNHYSIIAVAAKEKNMLDNEIRNGYVVKSTVSVLEIGGKQQVKGSNIILNGREIQCVACRDAVSKKVYPEFFKTYDEALSAIDVKCGFSLALADNYD